MQNSRLAPGMVITGIILAVIGAIAWAVTWRQAEGAAVRARFTDALQGGTGDVETSLWTAPVLVSVGIVILGVIVTLMGIMALAVRPKEVRS